MIIWQILMWSALAVIGVALVYLSTRVSKFNYIQTITKNIETRKTAVCGGIVFGTFAVIALILNFVNAIVCAIYFALIWIVCDFIFYVIQKICRKSFKCYYAGVFAVILSVFALACGWYLDHHVWQTNYVLNTDKNIEPFRIAMFADSHIGTTFDAEGFAKHMSEIQKQNPDVVVVVGDFVDDDTSRQEMVVACQALGNMKTKYGTYFVFGNHDKGYYGAARRGFSGQDLITELEKNGVNVLLDDEVLINNQFYIIGRRDFSEILIKGHHRKLMENWVKSLDKNKYLIVLDHQPRDFDGQQEAEVDLVLSGHTHGGQLFPLNYLSERMEMNDLIYGHEKRGKTDFIVTSGLSNWALKFKTGTKSEFVIIDIAKK